MPQYIAFLRGINVGGHRVKMDRLKELFVELKLTDVSTFIASGNVIFRTRSGKPDVLARKIETQLHAALGYEVPTILRTNAELLQLLEDNPFTDNSADDLYVVLLPQPAPSTAEAELQRAATADDEFRIIGSNLYWLRRRSISESKIPARVFAKALGHPGTARNITTLTKLAAIVSGGAAS